MTLLSFDHVEVWYTLPGKAVDGVTLAVDRGELVTIVGESGSGKSTLIRSAIGLLPANSRVSGEIRLDGSLVADTVSVMQRGQVVESGTVADILSNPRQEYTQRLIESVAGSQLRSTPLRESS
jgi:ABC-type glutathione transport system ATPase component